MATIKPKNIKKYEPIDLKLGIKSSLPQVKSTLALVISLWKISENSISVKYSEKKEEGIELAQELCDLIYDYYKDDCQANHIERDDLIDKINDNPLFKSQIEALIVALELIWKMAKVEFVDKTMPYSAERTGRARFEKEIIFTLNMDIVDSIVIGNESEYKKVMLHWMGFDNEYEEKNEKALEKTLVAFSENAIYKMDADSKTILFNNCGIYESLNGGVESVDINGDQEAKGSLRILKASLRENINPYLEYSNGNVSRKEGLDDYYKRVETYLKLLSHDALEDDRQNDLDEYKKAAEYAQNYVRDNRIDVYLKETEYTKYRKDFLKKFSPEKLNKIDDDKLLIELFYTKAQTNDSLCYWLERKEELWGSVFGGSVYKFIVNQKSETKQWYVDGKEVDEDRALEKGKEVRDLLVKGAEIIKQAELNNLDDYIELDKELEELMGGYYDRQWIHKYFALLYPEKLSNYHSKEWQQHILYCFQIRPSDRYYVRSGQIALISKYCGWTYPNLWEMTKNRFGEKRKNFYRLGSNIPGVDFNKWIESSYVAIGWTNLGDLRTLGKDDSSQKKKIEAGLPENSKKRAKQVQEFYKSNEDTVFVLADGEEILAIVDELGEYQYFASEKDGHRKQGKYHLCFINEKLPTKTEGLRNTCTQINYEDNLMFLYKRYFYELEEYENKKGFIEREKNKTEHSEGTIKSYVSYIDAAKIIIYGQERSLFATSKIRDIERQIELLRMQGKTGQNKASALEDYIKYLEEREMKEKREFSFESGFENKKGYERNRIIFGAPGTGKSHDLNKDCKDILDKTDGSYERVTFHPDYTYAQFVGTYKPAMRGEDIQYKFVPGPFMRTLVQALKDIDEGNNNPYVLIIEEINRAKVAAVFGDVFQLLDRMSDGTSEYEIETSEDIRNYMAAEFDVHPDSFKKIKIPNNMFIWATMNSADQGVFHMDTAFKRRWSFDYLDIDKGEDKVKEREIKFKDEKYDWNKLRKAINNKLSSELKINEDKLLGPFFVGMDVIGDEAGQVPNNDKFIEVFKNKVLMYLYEDVAKHNPHKLFSGCDDTSKYSAITKELDEKGIAIFGSEFETKYYDQA